jgi:hypothetical protein
MKFNLKAALAKIRSTLQDAKADIVWDTLHLAAHLTPRLYLWAHARLSPDEFTETFAIDGRVYQLAGYGAGKDRKYVMRDLGTEAEYEAALQAFEQAQEQPARKAA